MNKKYLLCMIVSALATATTMQPAGGQPFILTRSQSVNNARREAGLSQAMNFQCDCQESNQSIFSLTAAYGQSFKGKSIAHCLFGDDAIINCGDDAIINVTGSRVAGRDNKKDWLADYFGLPTDFNSFIALRPRSQSFVVDLGLYTDLSCYMQGLWLELYAPFVYQRNSLRARETVIRKGNADYEAGYFTNSVVTRTDAGASALTFLSGANSASLLNIAPLVNHKWSACKASETGLADIRAKLGWQAYVCERAHVSVHAVAVAPTGNRPTGEFLFEPIVGNGHHWELGGGASMHYDMWCCPANSQTLTFWVDATITHLFKARQQRVFDLKSSGNSRYMLAQEMVAVAGGDAAPTAPSATELVYSDGAGGATVANFRFNNAFVPVANLTCRDVDVKISLQADVVAKLIYTSEAMSYELGYNFWTTGCEKICPRKEGCAPLAALDKKYALKGDAFMFGFGSNVATPGAAVPSTTAVALSASQSEATINSGLNFLNVDPTNAAQVEAARRNPALDFETPAFNFTAQGDERLTAVVGDFTDDATLQTNSSKDPVFITENDLNVVGTKGRSHKIFAHINYRRSCNPDCLTPFFGVGFEAEFGDRKDGSTANCKTSCSVCTISQWAVWFKTGFMF